MTAARDAREHIVAYLLECLEDQFDEASGVEYVLSFFSEITVSVACMVRRVVA